MKKTIYIIFSLVVVFLILGFIFDFIFLDSTNKFDIKNMSYTVSGETFVLKDGKAEKEYSEGGSVKNEVYIFGEPVYGDFDKDGDEDGAIWLINNPGGSGLFFYAVLLINNGTSYKATNAMLLGDRIAPQTLEVQDGRALYNFAKRRADEPMTSSPSIGESVWIHYNKETGEIGQWVKDFEGESNIFITESEARIIAEKTCIKGGEALGPGMHNKETKTWWFDANLNSVREGCSPACVVSEDNKQAEINWRCTGLRGPK